MNSIDLRPVEQGRLPLPMPDAVPVDIKVIAARTTFMAAVLLCIQISGKSDKQVCKTLGIDAGHWSNMMKGHGHFPPDKINALMDYCGNEIPLLWLAQSRGYGLVMLEGEAERQLRVERDARLAAESKVAYLEALVTGKVGK